MVLAAAGAQPPRYYRMVVVWSTVWQDPVSGHQGLVVIVHAEPPLTGVSPYFRYSNSPPMFAKDGFRQCPIGLGSLMSLHGHSTLPSHFVS
jgi:hypothetical protein